MPKFVDYFGRAQRTLISLNKVAKPPYSVH
jgi:hypothetical protein